MSEIKLNPAHFKFETIPQRLKKSIMDEYNALTEKKRKTETDKMFIQMVQSKIKANKIKLVGTHIPTKINQSWVLDTKDFDAQFHMKLLVDLVKAARETKRIELKTTDRSFDGAPYKTCAGVMLKSNWINEIGKQTSGNDPFKAKSPKKPKVNYVGIELEFNANVPGQDQKTIAKTLLDAGLGKYVCVGSDGSCGWEVRVLLEEDNFVEPLTKIISTLKQMGFNTDKRCGAHVHLDMRNRDIKEVYKRFFATQMFLRKLVNKDRKTNVFCKKNIKESFDESTGMGDRYYGINTHSYRKYKTLEIRLHQGTLEASKLIPWIKLLLKIANFNGELTKKVQTLKQANLNYKLENDLFKDLQMKILNRGA